MTPPRNRQQADLRERRFTTTAQHQRSCSPLPNDAVAPLHRVSGDAAAAASALAAALHSRRGWAAAGACNQQSLSINSVLHRRSKGPNICSVATLRFHALE